jgi:hypothetical protein
VIKADLIGFKKSTMEEWIKEIIEWEQGKQIKFIKIDGRWN